MKNIKIVFLLAFFLKSPLLFSQISKDDIVDYTDFDVDLFNEILFDLINTTREKRRRPALRYNEKLEKIVNVELENRSARYFKLDYRRKDRLIKYMRRRAEEMSYYGSYWDCSFTYLPVFQFDEKERYFYKPDQGENIDFFHYYGRREENPEIKQHTYLSLAKAALKRMEYFGAKNFGRTTTHSDFACMATVEQKAAERMPYVKVLCAIGGYRLGLLK